MSKIELIWRKIFGWFVTLLAAAFIGYSFWVMASGVDLTLTQRYAIEFAERMGMAMVMLSMLHWYDQIRGHQEHDQLPGNYLAGRVIAVAIILSFGGIG